MVYMEIRAPYKCTAEMEIIVQMHGNHSILQKHGYPGMYGNYGTLQMHGNQATIQMRGMYGNVGHLTICMICILQMHSISWCL